jgi:hypothetical protein
MSSSALSSPSTSDHLIRIAPNVDLMGKIPRDGNNKSTLGVDSELTLDSTPCQHVAL